jgi:hypothetical protein
MSLNNINHLISVMVKCCVFFEVRTGFLNFIVLNHAHMAFMNENDLRNMTATTLISEMKEKQNSE